MSLHLNWKLKIPDTTAIVVNVGAMRKELTGCIHRFVGSFAVVSRYYHWNCLLLVTLKRVGLLSCSHHWPLHHSLPQDRHESVSLLSELLFSWQIRKWIFLGFAKPFSKLLQWIPWPFLLWQIRAWAPERPCGNILRGSVLRAVPWKLMQGHLSILLKCMWGFLKLFLYSRDYIMIKFLLWGYHISIIHIGPTKFTWAVREVQGGETEAANADLEMCDQPSQISPLVLSSKDLL